MLNMNRANVPRCSGATRHRVSPAIGPFEPIVGGFLPGKLGYGARVAAWLGAGGRGQSSALRSSTAFSLPFCPTGSLTATAANGEPGEYFYVSPLLPTWLLEMRRDGPGGAFAVARPGRAPGRSRPLSGRRQQTPGHTSVVGALSDLLGERHPGGVYGLHDDLFARALVLDDGPEQTAILSVDSIGYDNGILGQGRNFTRNCVNASPPAPV